VGVGVGGRGRAASHRQTVVLSDWVGGIHRALPRHRRLRPVAASRLKQQ